MFTLLIYNTNYSINIDKVDRVIGLFDSENLALNHLDKIRPELETQYSGNWSFSVVLLEKI